MKLVAQPLSAKDFAPFGRVMNLLAPADEPALVPTEGPGWSDAYTAKPLLATNGSLGLTSAGATPFDLVQMERHPNTEEALFCMDAPIVLVVAPAGPEAQPDAATIRAFVIQKGTAVVLRPGTWHDACRGVDAPVAYYWMATVGTGTEWQPVLGGPLNITCDAPA